MKSIGKILGGLFSFVGFIALFGLLHAQDMAMPDESIRAMTDLDVMLQALEATTPTPAESLPIAGTFWSAQHVPGSSLSWPPLPSNFGLPAWSLGDGVYLLNDTNVDYAELQAESETAAKAKASKLKKSSARGGGMEMMMDSLISGSGGAPVYLTNLVATPTNGSMTVTFSIAGGTNGFAYDIYTTRNLTNSPVYLQWTWLGQGYTTNSYTFTNQPIDQAFYILAIPRQTMVVAWGDNASGQCDVPSGLTNAIDVAGGFDFSLALKADGTVVAWGNNIGGATNVPANLTNVTSIAAGREFALALLQNGTVMAWGTNDFGQTNVPAGLTNVTAIAAGEAFSMALRNDGTVVAWGNNTKGQTNVPVLGPVKQITAGYEHSVALLTNGMVAVWGINGASFGWNITNVPVGLSNVVSIAAGGYHTLALKADGTVMAWGAGGTNTGGQTFNNYGQSIVPAGLSNVVVVAGGGLHSMAVQSDGTVVEWGSDAFGQTNLPDGLTGVKAISGGGFHSLAVRSGHLTPVILEEPDNQFALAGGTVTFSSAGEGIAGVQYQWQFNGVNITGATNASLTLTNVQATNEGSYQVIISNSAGFVKSDIATFTLVLPPQILSITPFASSTYWIGSNLTLNVTATDGNPTEFPLNYQWQLNGTNDTNATTSSYLINPYDIGSLDEGYYVFTYNLAQEATYTLIVSNAAGSTNTSWDIRLALPGMVAAWGADGDGECDRPITLTNTLAIASGEYHSVAVKDNGAVVQWGTNWGNVPTNLTNALSAAAGYSHTLALKNDGTVVSWGATNDAANFVPTNLFGVTAIAAGWNHNLALLTNGTVTAWGVDGAILGWHLTEIPNSVTNVTAISAQALHSLALRADGTVVAWGYSPNGETNVPAGLSNVVAIAAGGQHNLALKADGTVVAWGLTNSGQCNVPAGLSNVMAISAGWEHSVALRNDGTLVIWGDNSEGQTVVPNISGRIKLIAAGGDHTLAAMLSPTIQYPVDVTKDLLLIYNTNSADSAFVKDYYLAHRPMVNGANVLGVGFAGIFVTNGLDPNFAAITNTTVYETITYNGFTNQILAPLQTWLNNNPTKRPQYAILFLDVPSRMDDSATVGANYPFDYFFNTNHSVTYLLTTNFPTWNPFVTCINMNGTNDCIAYINKLAAFGTNYSPGKLIISASAGGYGDTNYYFDDTGDPASLAGVNASNAVVQAGVSPASVIYTNSVNIVLSNQITSGFNVAGYFSGGQHTALGNFFPLNGHLQWSGSSGWWIIETVESFNGQRYTIQQSNFIEWFSPNAFGGTNYLNVPVGAVSHTDEPGSPAAVNDEGRYFGDWASGKNFAICAWVSRITDNFQAVGDPFVKK